MDLRTAFWQKLFAKSAAADAENEQNIYTIHGWEVRTREFSILLDRKIKAGRFKACFCAADLGCGSAWYSRKLSSAGLRVMALDLSAEMLAAAKEKKGSEAVGFCRADCCVLPFRDHSFDLVLSVGAICIVEDPQSFLSEISRVLKPGGELIIVALNRAYSGRLLSGIFSKRRIPPDISTRGYTPFELRDELSKFMDFQELEITPLYILPRCLRPLEILLQRSSFFRLPAWRLASAFMVSGHIR
ncbi:MAG: hypothetical protein A2X49_07970 [Lentisphaerae bacterium GWF2_52_8]|nr:MAG: hypothetical protein A2X49_07970 [Lentisphaerae bacterium GWF2_52_8]